jgi:hypothetical protein
MSKIIQIEKEEDRKEIMKLLGTIKGIASFERPLDLATAKSIRSSIDKDGEDILKELDLVGRAELVDP